MAPIVLSWIVGNAPSDEKALAAVRQRQETVKTAEIQFRQTEVIVKGALTIIGSAPGKPLSQYPKQEIKLESMNRLIIDGDKSRFENNHPVPDLGGKIIKRSMVTIFNGFSRLGFWPTGATDHDDPRGVIETSALPGIGGRVLAPVELSFRGLNPQDKQLAIGAMKPKLGFVLLEGDRCQEFEVSTGSYKANTCWLAADKDYVLRRMRTERRNGIIDLIDVGYRRHEACGWVPDSWTVTTNTSNGVPLITTNVTVLAMRLNEPQSPEVFDIVFPLGTIVSRSTHGGQTSETYEVQNDGTMREITRIERANQSLPESGNAWHQKVLLPLIICLAIIVTSYIFKRTVRRNQKYDEQ
jgi:hypothetical protein